MKLAVLLVGIAALAWAGAEPVGASESTWVILLRAADQNNQFGLNSANIYGTKTGANDDLDIGNDSPNSAGLPIAVGSGSFDLGAGPIGNGYYKDLRAEFTTALTWHLSIWLFDECTATRIRLTGWNLTGSSDLPTTRPMELSVLSDPTGTYAAGTRLYTWDGTTNGTSDEPEFSVYFENAQAVRGAPSAGVQLVLQPAVPEPSPILGLLSGLGVFGFATRKRR